jgi:hypothetical protein
MKPLSTFNSVLATRLMMAAAILLIGAGSAFAQAQASAADLGGSVSDPNGAGIPGATVTVRSKATGFTRSAVADASGEFRFIGLPPGSYSVTAESANFKKTTVENIQLTVGLEARLNIKLELGEATAEVVIDQSQAELIESSRTTVANTIDSRRIENLPINERSATGFALTLSTVGRDNGRPIGPAPTSGLNVGGQRGRSTQVNVDGADFTDNSINAARSTVSQEAVQEYQVATNSYSAEFGRATGGVVNVVTKGGTNELRGNVFGFIRDKAFQSRNAFAPVEKPDYRRTQWGATIGGPIVKNRTFFFAAFERRQRDESGFFTSNVNGDGVNALTGSVTVGAPILPFTQVFARITPAQAAFANQLIGSGNPTLINAAVQYLYLASSGGHTALTGTNPLISAGGAIPAGQAVGGRFFLTGAPIPVTTANSAGQRIAFRPLNDLQRVFPVTERANYFSVRGDHTLNDSNQLTMRFGYNPINQTGIQVESQNQSLGQNDFSRTGITDIKDYSFSTGLNSTLSGTTANEFRFSWGRRKTSFRSQNGDAVAFNISGTAFIGRELFSPVDRSENRIQIVDNFNWVLGSHTLKMGADFNWVNIPTALFELNFSGLFNFGDFAAANLGFPASAPAFTPIQSYGLGLPSTYIQGFGNPISKIKNKPIAFYVQDSWRVTPRLTFNYGLRYETEFTETIAPVGIRDPLSNISLSASDILAAQNAVGVQQGIPRDKNNWAPRGGFAWDIKGDGKGVVRGSFGLYYDHPLLAVAFNSDIADASQQQQSVLTAGSPAPTSLLNAAQVFQGTVCVPGSTSNPFCVAAGSPITPGVAPSAQYQFGRMRFNDQTYSGFGAVLPFTLPISSNFEYASAVQGNLSYERQIGKNMSLTMNYIHVGARNLPRPTDLNAPNSALQIQNFARFAGRNPISTQEAVAFSIPTSGSACPGGVPLQCFTMATPTGIPVAYGTAGQTWAIIIPGMVAAPLTNLASRVVAPAIANFFRPNAPNYFLASSLSGGAVSKAVLDSQLAGSLRTTGLITPFGAVNAQASDGNSDYNALNMELKRRFANNFTFLASYTWSRSIDDSSDLQTLLIAQDVNNFKAEKADSLFDQRHRFVFSGVWSAPASFKSGNFVQKMMQDMSIAPIIELSSGRPFNIITNVDANNDQSSQTDRPTVTNSGLLCVPGTTGCDTPLIVNGRFATGNLGRNMGLTNGYAAFDLRLTRTVRFGEKIRLDLIAEGFNLFNRFNEASASPFMNDVNATNRRSNNERYYSRSTAAFDSRNFQFGAKLSF